MTVLIETRVVALEYQVASHGKAIDLLQKTGDTLHNTLRGVQDTLQQIKWLAMGAAFTLITNELGILKALKVVFGLG